MADLFLAPHNDDETLFGSFTIIRQRPYVVICLRSSKQNGMGISAETREAETAAAMQALNDTIWWQGETLDTDPHPEDGLHALFATCERELAPLDRVYAPAVEEGGHEQHNLVGQLALDHFGRRVQPYLTYRRGSMRSRGREVGFEPDWPALKLQALSCYESQIALPATQPWFLDDTLREYMP